MAVEDGNITPMARRPDGIVRLETEKEENLPDGAKTSEPTGVIQVPSSLPPPTGPESEGINSLGKSGSNGQRDDLQNDLSEHSGSSAEDEDEDEAVDENSGDDERLEVSRMDWDDFKKRYHEAMIGSNNVEEILVQDFEKLSKCFVFWADASSMRDNDRAWKRLKSREQYVRLSEQKLEDKTRHYTEVVKAFQKALELLRL